MSFFQKFFFPFFKIEWNKLDRDIYHSDSSNIFMLPLLKFVRPVVNSIVDINDPYGLQLLTRLRLGLSYLHNHKFRHNRRLWSGNKNYNLFPHSLLPLSIY